MRGYSKFIDFIAKDWIKPEESIRRKSIERLVVNFDGLTNVVHIQRIIIALIFFGVYGPLAAAIFFGVFSLLSLWIHRKVNGLIDLLADNENDINVIEYRISYINFVRSVLQAVSLIILAFSDNAYVPIIAFLIIGVRLVETAVNSAYSPKALVASTVPLIIGILFILVSFAVNINIENSWIFILTALIFTRATYAILHKLYNTFYNYFLTEDNYEAQSIELQNSFQRFEEETALRHGIEQASNTGIFKWYFKSDETTWSCGIYKALGIAEEVKPLKSLQFLRRVDHNHAQRFLDAYSKCKRGEKTDFEFAFYTDMGRRNHISCSVMPIFDENLEVIGVQGLLVDQTRMVNVLEELKLASRVKSEFLANMSHEIRTPLNGVIAVANLLGKTRLNKKQKEMVSIIENSGDSLKTILNDVLDLARVESGRLEIEQIEFNLSENLNAVASLFQFKAKEKSLEFISKIDATANQLYIGDPNRIKQIASNFLSNAIKFTDSGNVKLQANIKDDNNKKVLELVVKDSGCGIDKEKINKLFNRFEQIDGSITRQYGGSGLGLAISKALTDLMGGEIRVTSKIGVGTTFTLIMPLLLSEKNAIDNNAQNAQLDMSVNDMKILAAEDNETNLQVLSMILSQFDCDLTMVENGQEALNAFKIQKYDLVLMDIQMPIMDGLTAIKLIRAHEKENNIARTPIIALSANAMTHHITEALQVGATLHVAKPFTPNSLIQGIENAFDKNQNEITHNRDAA